MSKTPLTLTVPIAWGAAFSLIENVYGALIKNGVLSLMSEIVMLSVAVADWNELSPADIR